MTLFQRIIFLAALVLFYGVIHPMVKDLIREHAAAQIMINESRECRVSR